MTLRDTVRRWFSGPTGPAPVSDGPGVGPSAAALEDGYEVKDLNAGGLGIILAVMGGTAAAMIGVVFLLIALFGGWDHQQSVGLTAQQLSRPVVPAPHLQTDPVADLRREQARERHVLDGYAWNDAAHTRAHIPIARAMTLVIGRSLDQPP